MKLFNVRENFGHCHFMRGGNSKGIKSIIMHVCLCVHTCACVCMYVLYSFVIEIQSPPLNVNGSVIQKKFTLSDSFH